MIRTTTLALSLALLAAQTPAQVMPTDAAPRQFAHLLKDCGKVDFPIGCSQPENQQYFDLGLAHLHVHSFMEAERYFRQILMTEPDQVMAYWGMAMCSFDDPQRAANLVEEALFVRAKAPRGEQQWLDALVDYYEVTLESAEANRKLKKREGGLYLPLPKKEWKKSQGERDAALLEAFRALVRSTPETQQPHAQLLLVQQIARIRGVDLGPDLNEAKERLGDVAGGTHKHFGLDAWRRYLPASTVAPNRPPDALFPALRRLPEAWHAMGRAYDLAGWLGEAAYCYSIALRGWHKRMARHRMMPFRDPGYAVVVRDYVNVAVASGGHGEVLRLAGWAESLCRHPFYNQTGNPDHLAGMLPLALIRACGLLGKGKVLQEWATAGKLDPGKHRFGRAAFTAELGLAHARLGDAAALRAARQRLRAIRADAWQRAEGRRIDQWLATLEVHELALAGKKAEVREHLGSTLLEPLDHALCLERIGEAAAAIAVLQKSVDTRPTAGLLRIYTRLLKATGQAERAQGATVAFGRRVNIADQMRWEDVGLEKYGPRDWQPFQARDWQLKAMNGKTVKMSDYKGKPVVLILYLGFG